MEIHFSLGFISYLTSGLLFLFILTIYFIGFHTATKGKSFLLLVLTTLCWSFLLTLSQIGPSIAFEMVAISELLRYFTWFYVIQSAMGLFAAEHTYKFDARNLVSPFNTVILVIISLITLGFNDFLATMLNLESSIAIQIAWMLVFSIFGLILVEQLFRNASGDNRLSINLLCISAGSIFIYDFFVFSNALLVQEIDYEFWSARGIVNVLIVPTLLVAAVRNPELAPNIHISRQFIFHSTTLLATGFYLVVMAGMGYYVRELNVEWGKTLQASFLFAALLLLVVLFFSASIKTKVKRYLVHSFRNKYDYREEWNRFSRTILTYDPDQSLFKRAIQAIAQIVDSKEGTLWMRDGDQYNIKACWGREVYDPGHLMGDSKLLQVLRKNKSLISRAELIALSAKGDDDSHWIVQTENCWFIMPLWVNNELFGFVILAQPAIHTELDLEDVDLLNTVAHHVSMSLFSKETDLALQQAQKFSDMNQMTAFLVHDLKTVLSQLSLLVENSKIHRDNPDFIDDMINTVAHTTQKMQTLMQLLRNPEARDEFNTKPANEIFEAIVCSFGHHRIQPRIINKSHLNPLIHVNQNKLYSSIKNIVQNAVESVDRNGEVDIVLDSISNNILNVSITDNGKGMTQEFIAEKLFTPFDSTKGVSGMGVGAFQSREFFRSIGGDLQVKSNQNTGTCFTIKIPIKT